MSKFLLRVFASLALALVLEPGVTTAATPDTPEAAVKAFYTWYLQQEGGVYQLTDSHIYNYVAKPTVDNLRDDYRHKRLPGGADYFTRVQDLDPQIWLTTMTLHPAIALGGTAVIPVTFGLTEKQNLVVFVAKENGHWRITKVEDTTGYQGFHQYDPMD
ncbi:hypothetical protein HDG34_000705 [Paraburkholderia sp. HC6.4b]|uniref:DUF3828 domain-containing protein n=1 Tax=unclassified Paraburkholderia TaxID=2615204 RepID=UPI001609726E|nr:MULTISPECIES: DUF3828 domain-containing protein [unclassified Paraburkholderia]MBB5406784.1 hypothetical protein [Paraburkholderia sp. HC6.4b]MBB5449147.1 hypothetical protein [Paraburkholderia sp. Kb1A]